MTLDRENDGFIRQCSIALAASASGVHKDIPADNFLRRAQHIGLLLWDELQLQPYCEKPSEESAYMKMAAVAFAANLIAHNKDLSDNRVVIEAIESSKLGWQIHQEWRNKR